MQPGIGKRIWLGILFAYYFIMVIGDFIGMLGGVTLTMFLILFINTMSLCGVIILLFVQRKMGFYIICVGSALEIIYNLITLLRNIGQLNGILIGWNIFVMLIGGILIPLVTYLFIRKTWDKLA